MAEFGLLLYIFLLFIISLPLFYGKMTFYTYTYPPFSDCSRYSIGSGSSAVFGAEIELIRSGFAFLNWTEGVDYTFDCSPLDLEVLAIEVNAAEDTLRGIVGGITMTSERIKHQFSFCQPTASLPIRLAYRQSHGGLFFTRGLDTITWVLLFLTMFMIGGLLYFLEDRKTAYINMLYNVMCQFFLVADYPLSKLISKLVNYLSTFLVVITVIIFTAVSTNIFQADRDFGNSLNLYKMTSDQVVYSNLIFTKYLAQFGISYSSADIYDPEDLINQLDKVGIDFLLVDGPYSDYLVRQHCEFYTAPNEIDLIHYAIMFHKQFPKELQTLISIGVTKAKQLKSFEEYVDEYYNKRFVSTCSNKIRQDCKTVAIYELKGLWYILFCGIGIALTFVIFDCFGLILKKCMHIYDLKGIRSKMDRKIQRRYATLFAVNVTVSMQSIGFMRKLSQVALETHLKALKTNLSLSFLLFAYLRDQKNAPINPDQPETSQRFSPFEWFKKATIRRKGIRMQKSSIANKSVASNRLGRKKLRSSIDLGRSNFHFNSPSSKQPNVETSQIDSARPLMLKRRNGIQDTMRILQRSQIKKSTLLAQTNQAFHLDKKLHIKLDHLLEEDSQPGHTVPYLEKHVMKSSYATHYESKDETKVHRNIKNYIQNEAKSLIGRVFGRKGIKKNSKIATIGQNLLAEKEASLDLELSKKKSEILTRLSTLSLLRTSSNPPSDLQCQKIVNGDSPENMLKISIFKDIRDKNDFGYDSKDSHRILEITNKNSSEAILNRPFSTMHNQHDWNNDEGYSFEMKEEAFREDKGNLVLYTFEAHNFSNVVSSNNTRRRRFAEEC